MRYSDFVMIILYTVLKNPDLSEEIFLYAEAKTKIQNPVINPNIYK